MILDKHSSTKLIVGAIHSKSANTFNKWEQLKEQLYLAKKTYKNPQVWYVDINLDVGYTKTQKFLRRLRQEGWTTVIHSSWTHYNSNDYKNPNIDVILYRNFSASTPSVQFLEHNSKLSDHIPIKVTIKVAGQFHKMVDNCPYLCKKALYEHNVELL